MMSIIVRDEITGKLLMFVKGADTSVFPICKDMTEQDKETYKHVDYLAKKGLRTLCFAMKEVSEGEDFENMTAAEAERDMTFLGATAVEDLLQNEV
eukprot:CAMPEP_0176346888 /NCGR_PEP_ID=MMETSP0126-20121128/6582_1 /TAXON_ID=141414 ORGANISM="Strombidinopsis acuminatum, Strain SPMC142" /NCGR_SAMPLE_ID=MMETSP0126 /ASSEMBLY_ACC=CAM_ASM_000229 /LENGTH=95 /DNA_ID=CAMNT_0017694663 /DNA_START=430 /DNA_END=717 /DNA_ORIENTATION=-